MPGSLIDQTDVSDTDIRQGMPLNMLTRRLLPLCTIELVSTK